MLRDLNGNVFNSNKIKRILRFQDKEKKWNYVIEVNSKLKRFSKISKEQFNTLIKKERFKRVNENCYIVKNFILTSFLKNGKRYIEVSSEEKHKIIKTDEFLDETLFQ